MKRLIFVVTIVMSLTLAQDLFAADGWFSAGTKVTRVVAHDWGEVALVYLENNVTQLAGCPTNGVVAIKKSNTFFVENWQVAMTALVTQKGVSGFMYGGCYHPEHAAAGLGMPYITRLDIFR